MTSIERPIMPEPTNNRTQLAVIERDIEYIKEKVNHINDKLENDYVTHLEFEPIKRIVYGLVGVILTSVIVAVLVLVLKGV